ncbi:Kinesin-associated protein 3 [Globomyces sp. JEL0801]|nr:Kinesin-associated protein 3 [Globomyces sp. JEL0801]
MANGSQDELESFQLKKKIFPGPIDVHPTETAIIVHYTAQASILGEDGQPVAGDKKGCQKVIRLKSLTPQSNIEHLAKGIIEKCKLIHPSRFSEVEQILYYLQKRQNSHSNADESDRNWLKKQLEELKGPEEIQGTDLVVTNNEPSSMSLIEVYIEGLYEEIKEKVHSTRAILQLAKIPENMGALITNESLMSALSRVLREDGRRSMELVTNIIYIFFCFSNFSEFHAVITANKIGDMCLRITDQELTRFNLLVQDIQKFEERAALTPNDKTIMSQLSQEHSKFQNMLRKQDQLLFVSFHLLLNLAEDLNIEVKMIKRDIVKYLVDMLDRSTPELLILVLTFLKKLSVFQENKDQMIKYGDKLFSKLDELIEGDHQGLQGLSLRLALNLSHDRTVRTMLVGRNYTSKLVNVLSKKNYLMVTLQSLYQLSINEVDRNSTAFAEAIPHILRMILEYKGDRVNLEIMALAINIATVYEHVLIINEDNGLRFLMKRAVKTRDPLLFKMLRNISEHNDINIKLRFLDFIDDMMHLMLNSMDNPELLVEILAILGNLTIAEFDFGKLASTYDLLSFLTNLMVKLIHPDQNTDSGEKPVGEGIDENDDILLQCIILLGTMSLDENMAPMVAKTPIFKLLIDAMMGNVSDAIYD